MIREVSQRDTHNRSQTINFNDVFHQQQKMLRLETFFMEIFFLLFFHIL